MNAYIIEDPNKAESGKDFAIKLGDYTNDHTAFCHYKP